MTKVLFRQAAVEESNRDGREGELLRLETTWGTWTYRIALIGALAALIFTVVFDIHQYASGPAVVRVEGRRTLISALPGTVEAVHVQPGQHVVKDQLLVTMSAVVEEAELRRATSEFQ